MRAIVVFALCTAGQILPETAAAQRLEAARFAAQNATTDTTVRSQAPASRKRVFWVRALTASAGSVVGAAGGFALGGTYTPRPRHDFLFSDQEAVGFLVGYLAGAALGAAIHSYDSKCGFGTRFLRGLGGATLVSIPSLIIGPFGPGLGAAALQGKC